MAELKFKVNNKVEIISKEEVFTCYIQSIRNKCIAINIPIKDDKLEVLYYDTDSVYKFSSIVVKRENYNIPITWISIPDKFERIQRRKFVRVPMAYETKCALVSRDLEFNKENLSKIKFEKGIILDLSGGGVKLKTDITATEDDILALIVPVSKGRIIVKGEVKRTSTDEELEEKVYGINFIDLNTTDQEKIIEFVFQVMREQMKKGLREE
ncbi:MULTISPECIES: flagellar brake protein [Clostridium]|uniref:Flagellar brake protein YcgR n=1 Tax=Clostridium colicanis DSM 13634 TaxID=1121305 RepID=A0A151AQB0_9CLOT|nr:MULTISPECIES: PilZ domain-containing protein [Clostridium]KYH29760.1 flagellar brake protein YcgR [Clostridium colicanis DSM 13634]MBE6044749.1 PilZ domain-containing protein [Clostridium thermopalmarium]